MSNSHTNYLAVHHVACELLLPRPERLFVFRIVDSVKTDALLPARAEGSVVVVGDGYDLRA